MLSRRRLLAGAAGTAALAATGCGPRPVVRVVVSWSDSELAAFRAVLAGLRSPEYNVEVVSLGDDIATALGPAGSRYGRRPDLVMLPRPGLVAANLDSLEPLPAEVTAPWLYPPIWTSLLQPLSGGAYFGLPFKLANKSAVWYRKDVVDAPPQTWNDWLELNQRLVGAGVTPLALGAGDGWALTDFFENVLLGSAPTVYRGLAAGTASWGGPEVVKAFRQLGRMWAAPDTLAGGAYRAQGQQFSGAVMEVFGHRRAAMVVTADFAEPVVRQFAAEPDKVGVFPFPGFGGERPLVAGGDVAVLPKPAGPHARDLLRRLADTSAPLPWIERYGGFLAANPVTDPDSYSDELKNLATQFTEPGQTVEFDLSDQIGALGGPDGLWRVLQDLLVRVTRRGPDDVPDAAVEAARTMARLSGRD